MATWITATITIDDTTPEQATLVLGDGVETRSFNILKSDPDLMSATPTITEQDRLQTTAVPMADVILRVMPEVFEILESLDQDGVPRPAGHEVWTQIPLIPSIFQYPNVFDPLNQSQVEVIEITSVVETSSGPYSLNDQITLGITVNNNSSGAFTFGQIEGDPDPVNGVNTVVDQPVDPFFDPNLSSGTSVAYSYVLNYPGQSFTFSGVVVGTVLTGIEYRIPFKIQIT